MNYPAPHTIQNYGPSLRKQFSLDVLVGLSASQKCLPAKYFYDARGSELFQKAFEIYQSGYPANEFTGLPVSEELMRMFDTEFQKYLSGDITVDEMLSTVQDLWSAEF